MLKSLFMNKVLITGMGVISSIGSDVAENRKSLVEGKSGIADAVFLDSRYTDVFPFGEIPFSTSELMKIAGIDGEKGVTRTDILATLAVQEAFRDADLSPSEISE